MSNPFDDFLNSPEFDDSSLDFDLDYDQMFKIAQLLESISDDTTSITQRPKTAAMLVNVSALLTSTNPILLELLKLEPSFGSIIMAIAISCFAIGRAGVDELK